MIDPRARRARARARARHAAETSPSCMPEHRTGFALSLDDGSVERGSDWRGARRFGASGGGRRQLLRPRRRARRGRSAARRRVGRRGALARGRATAPALQARVSQRWPTRSTIRPEEVESERKAELLRPATNAPARGSDAVRQVSASYVESRRRSRSSTRTASRRATIAPACDSASRWSPAATTASRPGTRHSRRPRGLRAARRAIRRASAEAAARKALTMLDAVDAPDRAHAGRGRQRLRRGPAARGGRARPRVRRRTEARERLRRPARGPARRAVRQRLRRRQPRKTPGAATASTTRARRPSRRRSSRTAG